MSIALSRTERLFLFAVIAAGIFARFIDLDAIDFIGDEAHHVLGKNHAHPPIVPWIYTASMNVFGHTMIVARATAALIGLLNLVLLGAYAFVRTQRRDAALLTVALASVLSSHILFTKLVYLDGVMLCMWLLLGIAYEHHERSPTPRSLLWIFVLATITTFTKTQAFLPLALVCLWRLARRKTAPWRDPVCIVAVLSVLPLLCYVLTRPEIIASILTNTKQNVFGIGLDRLGAMLRTWQRYAPFAWPLLFAGVCWQRRASGAFLNACIIAGVIINFALGADHKYYTMLLVLWTFPLAISLLRLPSVARVVIVLFVAAMGFYTAGPMTLSSTSYFYLLGPTANYWNQNAASINAVFAEHNVTQVVVYPMVKHQMRWYLNPEVLAGSEMPTEALRGQWVLTASDTPLDVLSPYETVFDNGTTTIIHVAK